MQLPNSTTTIQAITEIPKSKRERERLKKRFKGFQFAVARKLSVPTSLVSAVWNGHGSSGRVRRALLDEINERAARETNGAAKLGASTEQTSPAA